jgi:hypothetical protein
MYLFFFFARYSVETQTHFGEISIEILKSGNTT